jgi:hypothetical protein
LYKNEELKTVCLSATGNGDAGFETIFTLGSCENYLPTLESYEQVNVSDFAVEVEADLSHFEREKNKTLEQKYVLESADESYAFESEINGPIYTSRAALEAEIQACKAAVTTAEGSVDSASRQKRIKRGRDWFRFFHFVAACHHCMIWSRKLMNWTLPWKNSEMVRVRSGWS